MRNNQPINDQEYVLRDGAAIISHTDAKGRITDCNEEFVEAAGFTREELIGQPHNIIRHPDMPEAAFEDLWRTLKNGRPWSGIVKNRRKDGGYYWVCATVTPWANGEGYTSVRIRPARADIEAAEGLYRRMNAGEKIILREGMVINPGLSASLNALFGKMTIATQLWLMAIFASILLLTTSSAGQLCDAGDG